MTIDHALDFIADLSYRLADESDFEDKLEEQFVSLWELVNSFKQENTSYVPSSPYSASGKT